MNNTNSTFIRRAGVLASGLLLVAGVHARAASAKPEADAFPNYESYIKLSGQAASISGSETAFQSRTKNPSNGGLGIEDLHLSKDLSKTTSLVIDGKALAGSEDYLGSFKITKNEVGSFEVGYKRFRTFYDGVGGFFPTNSQWLPLNDQDLHVDRAKFWAEGVIAVKGAPVFTLRYTNELRSGRKDSTIWGSSSLTGLPFNLAPNPINPARKLTPGYIDLSERNEELELSMKHKIGKTNLLVSIKGEQFNNLDTRNVTNFPGEAIPWAIASLSTTVPAGQIANPQNIAKAAAPSNNWNNQVLIAETEGMKSKLSEFLVEADTPLTDKLTLKVNGVYELVHTSVVGSRPLITTTPTATGPVPVTTNNYSGLAGGTRLKNLVGNVALDWKPVKTVFVKFAYRYQEEYVRGSSTYNVIAASGTPATTLATTPRIGWAKLEQEVKTPVLEIRYTGIKDLALYFSGSERDLSGIERNTSAYNPLTAALGTPAIQNVSEDHGNYTLGANWKVSPVVSLRGEVFRKGHKDNTQGFDARVGDYYLLDSDYSGFKLTSIVKPTPFLGFTTRYVNQLGKMKVTGFLPTYPAYDSLSSKNHMISESIDFTPDKSVYVQLNANLVFHVISTIYPRAGLTPAAVNAAGLVTANAFDSNRVVQNSNNNYMTLGFLSGWSVSKDTDAQFQCNYYRANNGNAALAALTLPYGVAVKDTQITVGLKHRFSEKWIGHAKVGYFDSANDTTGGRTNYHGPMAYLSFEHGL
ncbi:MAG: hypothetical protein HZA93_05985 [Verrucomicrobia bacterium]|nr:hypothetical protein [Verrucomicrobiota bacterium]